MKEGTFSLKILTELFRDAMLLWLIRNLLLTISNKGLPCFRTDRKTKMDVVIKTHLTSM